MKKRTLIAVLLVIVTAGVVTVVTATYLTHQKQVAAQTVSVSKYNDALLVTANHDKTNQKRVDEATASIVNLRTKVANVCGLLTATQKKVAATNCITQ